MHRLEIKALGIAVELAFITGDPIPYKTLRNLYVLFSELAYMIDNGQLDTDGNSTRDIRESAIMSKRLQLPPWAIDED